MQSQFAAVQGLIATLAKLVDGAIPEALGPPGVAGDPIRILHTAGALGDLYERTIRWGLAFRSPSVPELYERLYEVMPQAADGLLDAIEDLRDKLWIFIERFDIAPPAEGEKRVVELTVTLRDAIPPEAHEELEKIKRHLW